MSENPLFRKAALDKLASPERLDVLMQVTSPMGWLALTTVGGILVGVIVWSILGSIPERIDGQGVLLRGGANKEVRSTGSGTLASLDLKEGQMVSGRAGARHDLGRRQQRGSERRADQGAAARTAAPDRPTSTPARTSPRPQAQIARLRGDLDLRRLDLQRAQAEVARLRAAVRRTAASPPQRHGRRPRPGQHRAVADHQPQRPDLRRENRARAARSGRRRPGDRRSRSPGPSCSACWPGSARRSR